MSILRRNTRSVADVGERAAALEQALDAGGHRLEPGAARRARALVSKVDERVRLSADHTVVALAGATGSGKSSLFNALAGLDIAAVGARRPTTASAAACVWGAEGADELLEWLGVPRRHRVSQESALDAGDDALRGLVLLDLPDHDSTEVSHRLEVDRLVELVDVFVWVSDPQKYADAALHRRYLSRLAGHDAVTVVVLNHADRLLPQALETCRRDLERLVAADGLPGVRVIATSATTGAGIDQLRTVVAEAVGRRTAWSQRLAADLDAAALELGAGVGDSEVAPDDVLTGTGLVQALSEAAGVPSVVRAVERAYLRSAVGAGGWPVTRWVRRFRPDPLRRLRLGQPADDGSSSLARSSSLPRSSLPPSSPAQRAHVQLATRRVSDRAGHGLPEPWAQAVRAAAQPSDDDLADALDQAVVATDVQPRRRLWWGLAGALQLLLAGAAGVGFVWLASLAAIGALRLPEPATPYLGPLPWPTLLLAGGLVCGLLLGAAVRLAAGWAARREGSRVRGRLEEAIAAVARARVVAPVAAVLEDHRVTRQSLARAGGAPQ